MVKEILEGVFFSDLDVGGGRLLAVVDLDDEVVEFRLFVVQSADSVDLQRGRVALVVGHDPEDVVHVAADDLVRQHRIRVGIDRLQLAHLPSPKIK